MSPGSELPFPDPGNYARAHRTMPEEMRTQGSQSGLDIRPQCPNLRIFNVG